MEIPSRKCFGRKHLPAVRSLGRGENRYRQSSIIYGDTTVWCCANCSIPYPAVYTNRMARISFVACVNTSSNLFHLCIFMLNLFRLPGEMSGWLAGWLAGRLSEYIAIFLLSCTAIAVRCDGLTTSRIALPLPLLFPVRLRLPPASSPW